MLKSADLHETILTPVTWTERSPFSSWWAGHLRGKLKRPLTASRVNHWEIALYSSFFKLVKDIREKSMENNGDEIAVLFPEGHEGHIYHGSFVQVRSCDLRVDNKLFERWNYGIMISLNLLFRTLLWLFLYQDMEGNIDWLNSPAAVISLSSSYLMQIFQQFSDSFQMIRNIFVPVTRKW